MTPTEQRAQAEELRRLARIAVDPAVRASYLRLADGWDRLAREAESLAPPPVKRGRW